LASIQNSTKSAVLLVVNLSKDKSLSTLLLARPYIQFSLNTAVPLALIILLIPSIVHFKRLPPSGTFNTAEILSAPVFGILIYTSQGIN
jgi:hypothetical protein